MVCSRNGRKNINAVGTCGEIWRVTACRYRIWFFCYPNGCLPNHAALLLLPVFLSAALYRKTRALTAWFWVEAATFAWVARGDRNASICCFPMSLGCFLSRKRMYLLKPQYASSVLNRKVPNADMVSYLIHKFLRISSISSKNCLFGFVDSCIHKKSHVVLPVTFLGWLLF